VALVRRAPSRPASEPGRSNAKETIERLRIGISRRRRIRRRDLRGIYALSMKSQLHRGARQGQGDSIHRIAEW
jgi:hypothetical protein